MLTEEQIERSVQRRVDALDGVFLTTGMSQSEYDERLRRIDVWAEQQYRFVRPAREG